MKYITRREGFKLAKDNFERKALKKKAWKILIDSYIPKDEIYTQDWAKYDLAKTNEDIFVKRCLQELLTIAIPKTDDSKLGRKGYSIHDKIFCMCMKVYYRSDLRKSQSILKELKNLDLIDKVPCYKSIDNFFNDKELSKILDDLILISALPLASIETTGAIDATGFSTNRFERWFDHRYGNKTEGKKRQWRKLHAIAGCKSNVFISVELTNQFVADITMLESIVKDKIKFFDLDNFVADRAYSSRRVVEFIHNMGLVPLIPFKIGSSGNNQKYPIWNMMFDFFVSRHQEFRRKYSVRANIETCFHMLKQRYGDHLATKNFTANVNEIKVKVLCHNLCCLLTEMSESEIKIDFDACVKNKCSVEANT